MRTLDRQYGGVNIPTLKLALAIRAFTKNLTHGSFKAVREVFSFHTVF